MADIARISPRKSAVRKRRRQSPTRSSRSPVREANLARPHDYFATFPAKCETLHARGAQYHAERMAGGPHFTVNEGASAIGPMQRRDEAIRVLDGHRASVAGYRPLPTWIFLFSYDTVEYFYGTSAAVEASKPRIAPFVRAYPVDAAGRTLLLE